MAGDSVTIEHLDVNNYGTWSYRMKMLLMNKGLWAMVEDAAGEKTLKLKALSLIALHVKDHHLPTLMSAGEDPKLAWTMLENIHKAKSIARQLQLRRDINALRKGSSEPLTKYVARARTIWTDLTTSGVDIKESEVALSVLAGLPKSYDIASEVIQMTTKEPKLDDILTHLLPVEQRIVRTHDEDVTALASRAYNGSRPEGNPRKHRDDTNKKKGPCHYCGKLGHHKAECRKRIRDEAQHKSGGNRGVALTACTCTHGNAELDLEEWIIDSGASRHITFCKDILLDSRPLDQDVYITFGNGATVQAESVGTVQLKTKDGPPITLSNVLCVPGATVNLFSVEQATCIGAVIKFKNGRCKVTKNDKLALNVECCGGVYKFKTSYPSVNLHALIAKTKETPELWHRRFGHLGYNNLAKLVKADMVTGITVTAPEFQTALDSKVCEPCILAKHHKLPFPTSTSATTCPLERVHMDVCGPMPTPSLGGNLYVATFLDDFTGYSEVAILASKADVGYAVKATLTTWETQCNAKVKIVRSDSGTEYVNKALTTYFTSKGIIHETSAPYTPEQNGAAERLNRTLIERVRAMLQDAGLTKQLWAEAIKCANFIRNRSPVTGNDKTPLELFTGVKPDVSLMRTFGAKAYVYVPKQLRRKLDPTGERGVMIGYQPGSKAYRILLPSGKVLISRHVVFDEAVPGAQGSAAAGLPSTSLDLDTEEEEEHLVEAENFEHLVEAEDFHDANDNLPSSAPPSAPASPVRAPSPVLEEQEERRYPQRERAPPKEYWRAALANAAGDEPKTHNEALSSPQAEQWRKAMDDEMASLLANKTWTLEEIPDGVKPIPVRWVFKVKRDSKGNVERYKARLVAKGFKQQEGVDYNEVFAPVSKHTTLRTLLAIVAHDDLELHQLDVKTAFLNGDLEEDIYMAQPPGYEEGGPDIACHLKKALYGLRQAPRAWHTKLKQELELLGFVASNADPSLFILSGKERNMYLLVYVDDILIAGSDIDSINSIKAALGSTFDVRDLGEAAYFLGMEIKRERDNNNIKLSQERATKELLDKYGVTIGKSKLTPLAVTIKLTKDSGKALDKDTNKYSELIGSLLYLSVCTRPDIAQAVGALTRYMAAPTEVHWMSAKSVLKYLASTTDCGIHFGGGDSEITGFCDADFAGDIDTRRSTTGYVFTLYGGVVSWSSRLQPTVAASTTEAEYMAAAHAVKEALWLRKLVTDLDRPSSSIKIFCDNQATIALLNNPVTSARSKHIDVLHHFARERVARKEVSFTYCKSVDNMADCMTKILPEIKFQSCCKMMGLFV
jgi:transposase InsO family protein